MPIVKYYTAQGCLAQGIAVVYDASKLSTVYVVKWPSAGTWKFRICSICLVLSGLYKKVKEQNLPCSWGRST